MGGLETSTAISASFTDFECLHSATSRIHPDVRRCLNELHVFLPINRQHTWFPARRNPPPHRPTLLPGVPLLHLELVALWTLR
jgi:hypothetical protein